MAILRLAQGEGPCLPAGRRRAKGEVKQRECYFSALYSQPSAPSS